MIANLCNNGTIISIIYTCFHYLFIITNYYHYYLYNKLQSPQLGDIGFKARNESLLTIINSKQI